MTRINPHWWYSASAEQRLAQIDAGIELGMTARQISIASGARMSRSETASGALASFANFHGRSFGGEKPRTITWPSKRRAALAAYDRGEEVDFWSDTPRRVRQQSDEPAEISFE